MHICSHALCPESCRCLLFLGVIFIMLNDFIAVMWSVKGSHNKCWGFSITTPRDSAVNNDKSLCCMFDPAAIWLTFRWGLATVIHISSHSGLKTNIEMSCKGHFESIFVKWVDSYKLKALVLVLIQRKHNTCGCRLFLCFQVVLSDFTYLIDFKWVLIKIREIVKSIVHMFNLWSIWLKRLGC